MSGRTGTSGVLKPVIKVTAMIFFCGVACVSLAQERKAYRQEISNSSCDQQNPRYCSECRETGKRDFKKCDEVDYRKIDLLKSKNIPNSPPYLPPDYDPRTKKAVFAANIGEKILKSEIFIADTDNGMGSQNRLTWDANADFVNLDPFFAGDNKIAYTRVDVKNKTEEYLLLEDIRSGKRVKLTREQSDSLYLAAHKNPGK